MNRQKSFQNEQGAALYLVPTPIGNRNEISKRVLETLNLVDVIACEDTRNSGQLLKTLDIHKPLIAHHEYNTQQSIPGILKLLDQGKKIAIISDAGYPLISDPGSGLVQAVIEQDIPVISLSGPNAALNALVASGLSTQHYLYYGFLDAKSTKRKKELFALKDFPYTMIFYEAPHRIEATLSDVLEVFGNRKIVLARELTKIHEEYIRGTVQEVLEICKELKGEMVVVIEGNTASETQSLEEIVTKALELVQEGMKPKQAAGQACQNSTYSKNEVYQEMLKAKQ